MSTAAERRMALVQMEDMRRRGWAPQTLGGDKGYSENSFIDALMDLGIEPHVAARPDRKNALANQLHVFPSYKTSIRIRMFIETIFGWLKTIAGADQVSTRGHIRLSFVLSG